MAGDINSLNLLVSFGSVRENMVLITYGWSGIGRSRGGSGGSLKPPHPSPVFKYPMKMKLFHFHGIFKKNEIKSAKRTPYTFYIWTPFPEILDPPWVGFNFAYPEIQSDEMSVLGLIFSIPPANFVCRGYTVFTLSVHPSVRPSVRNALFP